MIKAYSCSCCGGVYNGKPAMEIKEFDKTIVLPTGREFTYSEYRYEICNDCKDKILSSLNDKMAMKGA